MIHSLRVATLTLLSGAAVFTPDTGKEVAQLGTPQSTVPYPRWTHQNRPPSFPSAPGVGGRTPRCQRALLLGVGGGTECQVEVLSLARRCHGRGHSQPRENV